MATMTISSKAAGDALWAALVAAGVSTDSVTGSRWVPQTWHATDADGPYPMVLTHPRFPADMLAIAAAVSGVTVS